MAMIDPDFLDHLKSSLDRPAASEEAKKRLKGVGITREDAGKIHFLVLWQSTNEDPRNIVEQLQAAYAKGLRQVVGKDRFGSVEMQATAGLVALAGEPRPGSGVIRFKSGNPAGPVGTLGCFLLSGARKEYLLGAGHAMTNFWTGSKGDLVYRESSSVTGTSAQLRLAQIELFNRPDLERQPTLDVGVAELLKPELKTAPTCFDAFGAPTAATTGMLVQKCGFREPHHTKGKVKATGQSAEISYYDQQTGKEKMITLYDQILVKSPEQEPAFGQPGDSGSLVATQDGNRSAIGILIAGDEREGVYALNRMDKVRDYLIANGFILYL